MPHTYAPAGFENTRCGACGQEADHPDHIEGRRNEIGADATVCPGCGETLPIELTVRMYRFVSPIDRSELHNVRVCKGCAGFEVDAWAELAVRRAGGYLTDEEYYERLARLDAQARTSPNAR